MVVKSLELLRIVEWLNKMEIKNYTINDDLSVDVDGHVWLDNRGLVVIPVQFNRVSGGFYCSYNRLTSLEGAPTKVGGGFIIEDNQLTSLEGAPTKVGGGFNCSYNLLTSLEGAPARVGGSFNCSYNQLTSLKGCPTQEGGWFDCRYNKVKFSEEDVNEVCKVGEEIYV